MLGLASALATAALLTAPPSHATPEQDQLFYDAMVQAGIELVPAAVPAAYEVCAQVWSGVDPDYVSGQVISGNPSWTLDQARAFVAVAIIIYCPPVSMNDATYKRLYT